MLAATLAASACTSEPPEPATGAPTGGSPSPETEAPDLRLRLAKVLAKSPRGPVRPRELDEPAEAIRAALEDLYLAAFVDPSRWDNGAFTGVFGHFSGQARERVEQDLDRLTLGAAAAEVERVEPERAVLRLQFLTDPKGRPVAAFAQTEFEAVALAGDERGRIVHRGGYVLRKLGARWRIVSYEVRGRVPRPSEMRPEIREAAFLPGLPSRDPLFVLVIGSDARPGQEATRTRADSIHVVGVNPRLGRASILGIPRDSWVPIPGAGSDKINAALPRGGPDLLVRTVERLTAIRIDAYLLTGFQGFTDLVETVGGIDARIPYPIHDRFANANFRRGPEHLKGREALAFARARHDVRGGDFGRSLNQGRLMIAALATLRSRLARDQAALLPWLLAALRELHTDLSVVELVELALAAPAFEPRRVRNAIANGGTGTVGGRSVVLLGASARARFRDLARDGILGG